LVKVHHLVKNYGSKTALNDVSFSIGAGQVVGLLGVNGAGKSTIMNILTGYLNTTSGDVSVGGYDIAQNGSPAKRIMGYLPEQPSFYPEMRVDEHLRFICRLKGFGKSKAERDAHIAEICGRVGIADVRGRMIRNLSKGYRQRVGFAQALIGSPKVIILDEPTVGLDPSQIIEIRKLIRECGQENTTLVSSHILSEIQAVCDRVLIIDKGRLIADGTPESITADTNGQTIKISVKGEYDRIAAALAGVEGVRSVKRIKSAEPGVCGCAVSGQKGCDIREGVFRALARADLPMLSSGGSAVSLEDVFLRLISGSESEEGDNP
jgi:ABC-2 type transport system ATP-binding protein